jgi:hypothetical protein
MSWTRYASEQIDLCGSEAVQTPERRVGPSRVIGAMTLWAAAAAGLLPLAGETTVAAPIQAQGGAPSSDISASLLLRRRSQGFRGALPNRWRPGREFRRRRILRPPARSPCGVRSSRPRLMRSAWCAQSRCASRLNRSVCPPKGDRPMFICRRRKVDRAPA